MPRPAMTISDHPGFLIVTADDWGYSRRYNDGMLEAVRAGAVDAVSAMVLRPDCDPGPLRESGVEVGLHLELPGSGGRREVLEAPRRQLEAFVELFDRPPAYVDGHKHCHAKLPLATPSEDLALELRVPLRAVGEDHRFRLEERGIASADRLIGRIHEREPVLPLLLADALDEGALPWGVTEWAVHPGRNDADSGSSYDRGREEDLALLLRLAGDQMLAGARATHAVALASWERLTA
jgi:predicted glycoside hydrolase/deacetylase ChbG (UPF0249 family)